MVTKKIRIYTRVRETQTKSGMWFEWESFRVSWWLRSTKATILTEGMYVYMNRNPPEIDSWTW